MTIRIGISGWRYAPWRGVFHPKGLPRREELAFASRCFDSIEINGSFHSLQAPASDSTWHDASACDFVFAVKGPRYITHMLRLRDVQKPLANFLASGVLRLGRKLGPILWQLPPTLRYDFDHVEAFLSLLPSDTGQALALARRRDIDRMRGRCVAKVHAPFDALALMRKLRLSTGEAAAAGLQPGLPAPPTRTGAAGVLSALPQPRRHPVPGTGSARHRPAPA